MRFLSLLVLVAAAPAFADFNTVCTGGAYTLTVHTPGPTAELYVNNRMPMFGEMNCRMSGQGIECRSKNVADAGYHASLTTDGTKYSGSLVEITFAGEKPLVNLTCDK
jgi:hypothetical protein